MRKFIIAVSLLAVTRDIHAQSKPHIFFNHLFFVLDSLTFSHLFEDHFLSTIGDTSTNSTTTTTDSWTGKYLTGKESYFEFFSSSTFKQVPEQGFGFGFITHTSGDMNQIRKIWKNSIHDSIETDTSMLPTKGQLLPWFYSIALYTPDSLQAVSTWLMENTPDELKNAGFTDEEIKRPITWQQYAEKLHKKKFGKPFNRISAVELTINSHDYTYLKKSLMGFGLKDNGKQFYNDDMTIQYTVSITNSTKLKSVTLVLDSTLPKHIITVSTHLVINVSGKTAVFTFSSI